MVIEIGFAVLRQVSFMWLKAMGVNHFTANLRR